MAEDQRPARNVQPVANRLSRFAGCPGWVLIAMLGYTIPGLAFDYDAFEPWCSAEITELHHQKPHRAYVDGANEERT